MPPSGFSSVCLPKLSLWHEKPKTCRTRSIFKHPLLAFLSLWQCWVLWGIQIPPSHHFPRACASEHFAQLAVRGSIISSLLSFKLQFSKAVCDPSSARHTAYGIHRSASLSDTCSFFSRIPVHESCLGAVWRGAPQKIQVESGWTLHSSVPRTTVLFYVLGTDSQRQKRGF